MGYYNSLSLSYSLNVSEYMDGDIHKLQLEHEEGGRVYDCGKCFFGNADAIAKMYDGKNGIDEIDGVVYLVRDEVAIVIGAISDIKSANILSSITNNGKKYPVTTILSKAFYGHENLCEVTIPEYITSIGNSAFSECNALTSLTFNAINCTSCGSSSSPSFPSSISSLTIGEGVTKIPDYFLYEQNCDKLTAIEIPENVTSIGEGAFSGCTALTSLTFNATNCTKCGSSSSPSFPSSISSLTIGDGVTMIPNYFLYNQIYTISAIEISENVTSIGEGAFSGCNALTSLRFNAINCTSCGSSSYPSFPSSITSVTIGDGVTKIPDYFLYNGSEIGSVNLPASLVSIGKHAFKNSTNLTAIEIPEAVTSIGESAFSGCNALTSLMFNAINCTSCGSSSSPSFPSSITSLTIGNGVTKIPDYFMSRGREIESVTLPATITSIGDYAFNNCVKLTEIEIPENVTSIGNGAFGGCNALTSLTFNAINCTSCGSVSYTGTPSFPSSITSLTIGDGVTKIPDYFLYNGSEIEGVDLPASLISIGKHAFKNSTKLTAIEIPEAVTSIGESAFTGCNTLTSLTFNAINCSSCGSSSSPSFPSILSSLVIGSRVTTIPDFFLINGSNLESVTLSNSVSYIGNYAFYNSTKLKSLTLGSGVLTIGYNAFSYNTGSSYQYLNIAKAFWLGNTPPTNSFAVKAAMNYVSNNQYNFSNQVTYQFLSSKFLVDGTYYIPVSPSERTCDAVDCEYSLENGDIVIGEKVTNRGVELNVLNINDYAYYKNQAINSLKVSNKGNVGNRAFYECVNLEAFEATNDGSILSNAFYNCDALTSVMAENDGSIGECAFSDCNGLKDIKISSKGDIKYQAFYGCNGLENATIDNVGAIGQDAFYGCNSLNSVHLGNDISAIGSESFYNCSSLSTITLPDNVSSIGNYAFYGCSKLATVNIGTGIPSIPQYAFGNCLALNNLSIPNNVKTIGDYAFSGCKSLANLTLEDGEESLLLGSNGSKPLFADCPLDEVYIGRKLQYNTTSNYGYSPFYRNTSLRSVEITDAETEVYDNEFYGCTNLQTLMIGNGVKSIGNRAFSGCSSLEYFSAGNQIESIGQEAFSDCTGLKEYYSFSIIPPVCGTQALNDINKWDCTLHVPAASSDEYMAADQWKDFFFVEEIDAVLAESLSFNVETLELLRGETFLLVAEFTPDNVTRRNLTWESSNSEVAKVSATGLVTALKAGEAEITATATDGSGVSASCLVTVKSDGNESDSLAEIEGFGVSIAGRVITVSGPSAAKFRLFMVDGAEIAPLSSGCFRVPCRGVYLLQGPGAVRKIRI